MFLNTKKIIGFSFLAIALIIVIPVAQAATHNGPGSRSYERNLLRLSEILGAIHHLRAICNANEGQLWRKKMVELLETEAPSPQRRTALVDRFNQGYRSHQLTFTTCTKKATSRVQKFVKEGATLATEIANARRIVAN
jgi:uncharacterized protein (TIGR02301 family)